VERKKMALIQSLYRWCGREMAWKQWQGPTESTAVMWCSGNISAASGTRQLA
jgi:hypothetical protein